MSWKNFFKPKTYKRRKVRQMSNFSTHVEIYIYVIMGLVILGSIIMSFYGAR